MQFISVTIMSVALVCVSQASVDKVQFVVSRRSRPQVPGVIYNSSQEILHNSPLVNEDGTLINPIRPCKEKHISVTKV